MDNLTTLQALGSGMRPSNLGTDCADACQPDTLLKVSDAPVTSKINLDSLQGNSDCIFEDTFHNGTGAQRNLVFGGPFSGVGEYQDMGGQVGPSAVDFATFTDNQPLYTNNTGMLKYLNRRFDSKSAIISKFIIQSNLTSQTRVSPSTGNVAPSGEICNRKAFLDICDYCPDNTNTGVFTRAIRGAIPLNFSNFLSLPVVDMSGDTHTGDYVLTRLEYMGEEETSDITACNTF